MEAVNIEKPSEPEEEYPEKKGTQSPQELSKTPRSSRLKLKGNKDPIKIKLHF